MKKYVKKQAVVEAIKWDGDIETIKNNEWLEMAAKEDKLILGINDLYDKEAVLLVLDEFYDYVKVYEGDYIIIEANDQKSEMRIMKSDEFEELYEVIEDNKNNCAVVSLELDTEDFHEKLNEAKEELEKVLNYNTKVDKDNFKIVTKEMYMLKQIGKAVPIGKEDMINEQWGRISKGFNFVLAKDGIHGEMYYSIDYINELFKRDKSTTCMCSKSESN